MKQWSYSSHCIRNVCEKRFKQIIINVSTIEGGYIVITYTGMGMVISEKFSRDNRKTSSICDLLWDPCVHNYL